MTTRRPLPGELEPIERASVDELRALQLERLRWSLRHAYDNVPHYRPAFDNPPVHCNNLSRPPKFTSWNFRKFLGRIL